jgi:hypothetical protein
MTKKDYELIAGVLCEVGQSKGLRTAGEQAVWAHVIVKMAMALEAQNPRFDARKFENACIGL